MRSIRIGLVALASTLVWSAPAAAIVGGHRPAAHDTRFDAVGAFSRARRLGLGSPTAKNPHDHDWWCAATLIAPDVVLTAAHCDPASRPPGTYVETDPDEQFTVRFRRHLDGTLGSKALGPSSFYHARIATLILGEKDVAIGLLEEPVPHITPIPTLLDGTEYLDTHSMIWHAGWGKEGPGFDEGTKNELLLADNLLSAPTDVVSMEFYHAWDPIGLGRGPNMHDSGGPILAENGASGELRIVGIVVAPDYGYSLLAFTRDPFPDPLVAPYLDNTRFSGVDLALDGFPDRRWMIRPGDSIDLWVRNFGQSGVVEGESIAVRLEDESADPVGIIAEAEHAGGFPSGAPRAVLLTTSSELPFGNYRTRATIDVDDRIAEGLEGNNSAVVPDRRVAGRSAWEQATHTLMVAPEQPPLATFYEGWLLSPSTAGEGSFVVLVRADRSATLLGFLLDPARIFAAEGSVAKDGSMVFPSIDASFPAPLVGPGGTRFLNGGRIGDVWTGGRSAAIWEARGYDCGTYRVQPNDMGIDGYALRSPTGASFIYLMDEEGNETLHTTDGRWAGEPMEVGPVEWDDDVGYRFALFTAAASLVLQRERGRPLPPTNDSELSRGSAGAWEPLDIADVAGDDPVVQGGCAITDRRPSAPPELALALLVLAFVPRSRARRCIEGNRGRR